MADDYFKVRNGFTVGEDAFTVDAATGDVVVTGDLEVQGDIEFTGDLAVNGGDITTTSATAAVFNTTATTVNIAGAGTTVSIGANTGTTTVNNDLVADSLTVAGDLAVNGADITTTATGTATVFNTNATTVNIGGAATTMSIGNASGTVTIPGNLTVNGTTTTINTQDLLVEDKNITIGNVAVPTDVTASGGGITLLGDTNKTITWNNSTDGWELNQPLKVTGDAVLSGDLTVSGNDIKSSSATAITLSGANVAVVGTLDVQGGTITDSTGALSITTGASNGNIILDPNGTGNVVMTFANGGNLTNDRNYVSGNIRQTVAASAGDIWGYLTGTTSPYRGISLDNYLTSTTTSGKRTGLVMRNYANTPRNSIIGESARGTNPSSPTQLTNNSNIIELVANGWAGVSDGTGFTSTGSTISGTTLTIGTLVTGTPAVGQLISSYTFGAGVVTGTTITANISGSGSGSTWTVSQSQTVTSAAINGGGDGWLSSINGLGGNLRFQAFENWTNQTSGTGMIVALSPLAATNGIAGLTATALSMSFSSTTLASDTQAFRTRPSSTGGTNFNMLNLTESLVTVGGDLRISGNDIQASDGNTNITLNGNTLTSFAGDIKVGGNDIQASDGNTNITMTSNTLTTLAGNLQVNGGGTSTIKSNEFRINNSSNNYLSGVVDNGTRAQYTWSSPYTSSSLLLDLDATASVFALYGASATGSVTPTFNFNAFRESAGSKSPTQSGDRLGQFTFNGNLTTGTGPTTANVVGGELRWYAVENWTSSQAGTAVAIEIVKPGTNTNLNVFLSSGVSTEIKGDTTTFKDSNNNLLIGNNINYNRVYGQWQNLNTIVPAADNTAYAFALPTIDYANVASVNTTSRIVPGAAGMYKLQFSVQVRNDDSAAEHIAYFWWRRNGTDVPGSMGRVGVPKAAGAGDALTIAGWDNMIESSNSTDYWELMYAVDDATHIDFPTFTATAFGPATSALFLTLVPVGA